MSLQSVSSFSSIGDRRINASFVFNSDSEIVRLISRFLNRREDVVHFGLTNRRLRAILLPFLPGDAEIAYLNSVISIRAREAHRRIFGAIPAVTHTHVLSSVSSSNMGFNMGIAILDIETYPMSLMSTTSIYTEQAPGIFTSSPLSILANNSSENTDEPDYYGPFMQSQNDIRHEMAIQNNTDGVSYLKSVIDEYIQALPQNEKDQFKKKIEESDPELFIEIPRLAVKKAISSSTTLTKKNTPRFMHAHLKLLEQLRQKQTALAPSDLWKECCNIATSLSRETDCIASMQKAFQ